MAMPRINKGWPWVFSSEEQLRKQKKKAHKTNKQKNRTKTLEPDF